MTTILLSLSALLLLLCCSFTFADTSALAVQRSTHLGNSIKTFTDKFDAYRDDLTNIFIDPPEEYPDDPVLLEAVDLDLACIFNLKQTPAFLFPFAYIHLLLPVELERSDAAKLAFFETYHKHHKRPQTQYELAILAAARHFRPFMVKQLQFAGAQIVPPFLSFFLIKVDRF